MEQRDVYEELRELSARVRALEKNYAELEKHARQPPANGRCVTLKEAAEAIGCTTETVRKYEREGFLPARYPMAERRFHPEDLTSFLRGQKPRKKSKK